MDNSEAFERAKKRLEAKIGFYTHLTVYAAVIVFLAVLDLMTSPGEIWFYWPMMGWGIAVAIHAASVFIFPGRFAVTEEMIERGVAKSRSHP